MKIVKYLPLLFLVVFANCEKSDETNKIEPEVEQPPENELPNLVTYLTYQPNSFLETSESDNWLVIHNQDGQLLDYRAYEKDDIMVFTALDTELATTESLVITTLLVFQQNNITTHRLETYTDIPIGINWRFGPQSASESDKVINTLEGRKNNELLTPISSKSNPFTITVTNIPGIKKYNMYGPQGVVTSNYNAINASELQLENIELLPNYEYILFIGDQAEGQKYIFFMADETTDQLVFDYNDFQEFEDIIETQLPENSYLFSLSRGFKPSSEFGSNFEMVVELDFTAPEVSRIGYIPGFDYYTTTFQLNITSGYIYRYYEQSQMPLQEIIILEKPNFTVNKGMVYDFSFDTDIDFIKTSSNWRYEENFSDGSYVFTDWTVNTTNRTMHTVGELPEEIVENYSSLFLDRIKLNTTSLDIRGRTYENRLESIFDPFNNPPPDIWETIILIAPED